MSLNVFQKEEQLGKYLTETVETMVNDLKNLANDQNRMYSLVANVKEFIRDNDEGLIVEMQAIVDILIKKKSQKLQKSGEKNLETIWAKQKEIDTQLKGVFFEKY